MPRMTLVTCIVSRRWGFSKSRGTWPGYDDKERLRGKFSDDVDKMCMLADEESREK